MATLLVYYSRTGATKKAAEEISRALNCQSEQITDVKSRAGALGYIKSGREAVLKKLPAIGKIQFDLANYSLIIIGTPVWAGKMASPLRTYLTREKDKIKKFALFLTQGGSGADRVRQDVEGLVGRPAAAFSVLSTKEVMGNSAAGKIDLFVRQIKNF